MTATTIVANWPRWFHELLPEIKSDPRQLYPKAVTLLLVRGLDPRLQGYEVVRELDFRSTAAALDLALKSVGYDEQQHPRDRTGEFTTKPGEQAQPAAPAAADDLDAKAKQVEQRVRQLSSEGQDTLSLYDKVGGAMGMYTPERQRQHEAIIDEIMKAHLNVPTDHRAVISGGLTGAGKTSTLQSEVGKSTANINPDEYITINPDDMKTELIKHHLLPEYPGINPGEASALIHEESSKLAWDLHYRAVAEGKNVIWDMTMSSVSGVEQRLSKLNEAGYKVKLVYVHTTVETSIQRSDSRYQRGLKKDPKSARYVPHAIITAQSDPEYGTKNRKAFESVKQKATDGWFLFDNNGDAPALLARSEA